MPGKVEKLPTAKRELPSTTCGPPRRPLPRWSWRLRDQCVGETAKQISVWTSCSKGETDAAGCLDDTNFVSIRQLYDFAGKCKSAQDQSLARRSRIV
jgi:hypothetical protein